MQRKRKLDTYLASLISNQPQGPRLFQKRTLIPKSLPRLKELVKFNLDAGVNNFVTAVLLCDEIFQKTKPQIRFELSSLECHQFVKTEFTRAVTAYSLPIPQRLDYIEYAGLANDIVYALIQLKKYSRVCELIDYDCEFAVLQTNQFIRRMAICYNATDGEEGGDILTELSHLFKTKCQTLFNCPRPAKCAYIYYYLYALCQHGLNKADELKLNLTTANPHEFIYLRLKEANKHIDANELEKAFALLHEESIETFTARDAEIDLDSVVTCLPVFYACSELGNPLGCVEIANHLTLLHDEQLFWLQFGMLQGNVNKDNSCVKKLQEMTPVSAADTIKALNVLIQDSEDRVKDLRWQIIKATRTSLKLNC